MNLKEAFRYQNRLQSLMEEAEMILGRTENITRVQTTVLRRKVMPEAEDEVTISVPPSEFAGQITTLVEFLVWLLEEREKLSAAVTRAKETVDLPAGLDGEVGLNAKRQEVARLLRTMTGLRGSETLIPGGGTGYRFNNEGNQVPYRCDVKRVTTINYDRNRVRKLCSDLSRRADQVSAALDAAIIETQVDWEPPFDVNEPFVEVFEAWAGVEPG